MLYAPISRAEEKLALAREQETQLAVRGDHLGPGTIRRDREAVERVLAPRIALLGRVRALISDLRREPYPVRRRRSLLSDLAYTRDALQFLHATASATSASSSLA